MCYAKLKSVAFDAASRRGSILTTSQKCPCKQSFLLYGIIIIFFLQKVNTKFYVRDDEMLDFLSEHMDILTERLKKRGYDCSFSMTTRGDDREESSGIAPILSQEKGVLLSQYAFDVRT